MDPLNHVIDVDSHEMFPSHMWGEVFGEASAEMAEILRPIFLLQEDNNDFLRPEITADDTPMTDENVWTIRGVKAPGSFDPDRRLEAMDLMGIDRQLIFPSCALFAFGRRKAVGDVGYRAIGEYNAWVGRITRRHPRLRPVAILPMDGTVDEAVRDAEKLIADGVRAVMVGINVPPCGISPAAAEMDRLWSLMEKENIAVLGHIAESNFLASDKWQDGAASLEVEKNTSLEVGFSPYHMSILHYPAMNYLTTLVLGGVFERFPNLRVGMMEFGAAWYGEFAENLDIWADVFKRRMQGTLTMKPSEYLNRNVRVTPFHFEPVDLYLQRHPNLVNSYCYASDYPHFEGGKRSKETAFNKINPLGGNLVQKYFVDNGTLLLPA